MAERSALKRWIIARRRALAFAGLIAAALLVFVAFVIASLPYDEIASKTLAPYRLKLVYGAQRIHLPFGVTLKGVSLVSLSDPPEQILLQSPEVALRPTLGSMLRGHTGLAFEAAVFRGTVHATLEAEPAALAITFSGRAIDLRDIPIASLSGASISGTVSVDGAAQIRGPMLMESLASATVGGLNVTVAITQGFPLIHLGTISGQFRLANGVLHFEDLQTHGGDVESRGYGMIQLAADPAASTISARLYLTPTPSGRAHFGLLFNMLPHPPAEGPYEIRGRLLSPSIS